MYCCSVQIPLLPSCSTNGYKKPSCCQESRSYCVRRTVYRYLCNVEQPNRPNHIATHLVVVVVVVLLLLLLLLLLLIGATSF